MSTSRRKLGLGLGLLTVGVLGVIGGRALQTARERAPSLSEKRVSGRSGAERTDARVARVPATSPPSGSADCPFEGPREAPKMWSTVSGKSPPPGPSDQMYKAVGASAEEEERIEASFERFGAHLDDLRDQAEKNHTGGPDFMRSAAKYSAETDQEILQILGSARGEKLLSLMREEGARLANDLPGLGVMPE